MLRGLFEPGFFSSGIVHSALLVGATVSAVSGIVGIFAVIRGQSFTTEAVSDVGATGGSAAYLVGVSPLSGFVTAALIAAGATEFAGLRRPRGRDIATGIVLGAALGLAALFLYFDTTHSSTTGATVTILFGSIFVVSSETIPAIVILSGLTLALMVVLYRRLLLTSLDNDLAAARGVSVRWTGIAYLVALSLAVALAAITIGAVLGVALLIGPAATALRLTRRPGLAAALAALVGVAVTWTGILLAYDSFYWPPFGHGWPVSFFVVALIFSLFLVVHLSSLMLARQRRARSNAAATVCH